MKNTRKTLFLIALISITSLYYWIQKSEIMKDEDACLCSEILSNNNFLENKDKIPSVKKCINSFGGFDNAHLKCMEIFQFKHPEIKQDSLKSI